MGAGRDAVRWLRAVVVLALAAGVAVAVQRGQLPAPLVDRIGLAVPVTGALAVLVLLRAAARSGPVVSRAWFLAAVCCALLTAFVFGAEQGWDERIVWYVIRPASAVAALGALLTFPGVRRDARQWRLVVLDGWMIAGSLFVVSWVALRGTGLWPVAPEAASRYALAMVVIDLLVASACGGLAVRAMPWARPQVVLLMLACLTAACADATSGLTGNSRLGTALWCAVLVIIGSSAVSRHLNVFHTAAPDRGRARMGRLSQLIVVPGLVAALGFPPPDRIVAGMALSLLFALAVQMLLLHRHQDRLYAQLREQAGRLNQLVRGSRDAILQISADGNIEFANDASAEVLGRAPNALTGRPVLDLMHPDDRPAAAAAAKTLGPAGVSSVRVMARVQHGDGIWHHVEATVSSRPQGPGLEPSGWTASTRDVTERVRLEQELRLQANTDALTGLTNRHTFVTLVDERLRESAAVVLFLDLDGFKTINDTDGHARGDEVLRRAGALIREALQPGDVAGRLGGDEFAVLLGGLYTAAGGDAGSSGTLLARGVHLADRLVQSLAGILPPQSGGRAGVSIGVAAATEADGAASPGEALLRDADLAMYEAKSRGGGRVVVFEDLMRERVLERTRRQAALQRAIEGQGLLLHVQPIVNLEDGSWVGFEALVRWQDGNRLRGPADFIPLAEETGLIVPLGTWVLRAALQWLARWPDQTTGIAVNVAARQVADPHFGDIVRRELTRSRVDPSRLTLEVTEQTAVQDLARAGAVLQPLRALGVHVALDDFGTGFSSLGYLAQLPVDELKIDQKFVAGLGVRSEDEALVRAVIGLADDLGLHVVAEGVETEQQRQLLCELGGTWAQGYLFSRPTAADELLPPWRVLDRTPGTSTPRPLA